MHMKKIVTILIMATSLTSVQAQTNATNPLLQNWTGPYGGVPAFTEYKVADFKSAFDVAIKQKNDEINAIANNTKPATFDNTIAQLERSGKTLSRVMTVYGIFLTNSMGSILSLNH